MGIEFDSRCVLCHLQRNIRWARALADEPAVTAFAKELAGMYARVPEGTTSPELGPETERLFARHFHLTGDRFLEEKRRSNAFALERLPQIQAQVEAAEDPVLAALQFAVLGNYIDFAALHGEVSFEKLEQLLADARKMELDMQVYRDLHRDLDGGKRLLYLTDNAGEIVFDRVLAQQLHKAYPHLQITFCVRGGPAANDATREDATTVGLEFPVIDNGNTVAGTVLRLLGPEAQEAFRQADVILSKGQGNAETLLGCGYNLYYVFLAKCVRFTERYGVPKLTPMLVKERV